MRFYQTSLQSFASKLAAARLEPDTPIVIHKDDRDASNSAINATFKTEETSESAHGDAVSSLEATRPFSDANRNPTAFRSTKFSAESNENTKWATSRSSLRQSVSSLSSSFSTPQTEPLKLETKNPTPDDTNNKNKSEIFEIAEKIAATAQTKLSESPSSSFQYHVLRNIVNECLQEYHEQIRADIQSMHVELIRQFQIQKVYIILLTTHHGVQAFFFH